MMGNKGMHTYMPPLRQTQLDFITQCYQAGKPSWEVAPLVPCARPTINRLYRKLRLGQALVQYDPKTHPNLTSHQPYERRLPKPYVLRKREKFKKPPDTRKESWAALHREVQAEKRPLVNPARFYRSEFVPT